MTTANNKITLGRTEQALAELGRLESRLDEVESALGIRGCSEISMWERSVRELKYFFEDLLEEMRGEE